jgi:hypothetical protein
MRDRVADIAYRTRQMDKGYRQLSVWVPAELQLLLVEAASIARTLPPDAAGGGKSVATLTRQIKQVLEQYRPSGVKTPTLLAYRTP